MRSICRCSFSQSSQDPRSALMRHGVCDNFPTSKQTPEKTMPNRNHEKHFTQRQRLVCCVFLCMCIHLLCAEHCESVYEPFVCCRIAWNSPSWLNSRSHLPSSLNSELFRSTLRPFTPFLSVAHRHLKDVCTCVCSYTKRNMCFNHSQFHLMCLLFPSKLTKPNTVRIASHILISYTQRQFDRKIFRLYPQYPIYLMYRKWVSEWSILPSPHLPDQSNVLWKPD